MMPSAPNATQLAVPDGVHRVRRCNIACAAGTWAWAERQRSTIDAHWRHRLAQSPAFFNGGVFVMPAAHLADGVLSGHLVATDFASALTWRETGFPDTSVADCFCAALLLSSDGALFYGRQSPGNVNAGKTYPPSGFIDSRDIAADGTLDIDAGVARELAEETGIDASTLTRAPGYIVSRAGPLLCVGVVYRASQPALSLAQTVTTWLARSPDPELEAIVPLRTFADCAAHAIEPYARQLAQALLEN